MSNINLARLEICHGFRFGAAFSAADLKIKATHNEIFITMFILRAA